MEVVNEEVVESTDSVVESTDSEPKSENVQVTTENESPGTMTIVLDQSQYDQILSKFQAVETNQYWSGYILAAILGALIIQSFWSGWRSTK